MAFNPFAKFRKHQKVVFAGLTIMCMLTFVLMGSFSSGGGDFFYEMQRILVGGMRKNEVAKLYGNGISIDELMRLQTQRLMAERFMAEANQMAFDAIRRDVEQNIAKFGPSQQD